VNIYLLRHAEAVDGGPGVPEAHRFLTPEGRDTVRETARNMRESGAAPGVILTSPLIRAVQTADILAETLSYSGPLLVEAVLSPGFDRGGFERLLSEWSFAKEAVLVGHEPDLSDLVRSLSSTPSGFRLKKGAAVALSVDPARPDARARFLWMALGSLRIASPENAPK